MRILKETGPPSGLLIRILKETGPPGGLLMRILEETGTRGGTPKSAQREEFERMALGLGLCLIIESS